MIPLSVFVVHPDSSIAARIARAVAAAGHAPVLLGDGERAIDRFVQEPADVVVLDFFLPGRDGVATIESIRWAPGGREAHVVLLADRETDPPLAELGNRIGAIATLVGPPTDAAIAGILEALGRPPHRGESTRVASLHEIDGELEKLGLAKSPIDRRPIDARISTVDDEGPLDPPGDELGVAWPIIETIMAHTSPRGAVPPSASGVQRRPEASARAATPPPPISNAELFAEHPPGHAALRPQQATPHETYADADAMEEGRDVGEGARAAAEGSQRIMGRFEDTAFPALLRRLSDLRTSGALVCIAEGTRRETTSGDPPTKLVYFRSGVPVHVRSNLVDECLGQILVRRRRIGVATLEESIRRMRLGEGMQGEILIDMGALAPIELGEALAEQARDKLFDVFSWKRGTYRLSTKLELPTSAVGIELGLAEIVYEGVCASMPASRLLAFLSPSLARYVIPDPVQLARFVRVRLVPEVRHVLARIDGTLVLRDVLSMGSRPGAVAQLVYAMECLGAVRFSETPARAARSGAVPVEASAMREILPEEQTFTGEDEEPSALDGEQDAPVEPAADEEEETVPPPNEQRGSLERVAGAETPSAPRSTAPPAGEPWDDPTAPQRERVRVAGAARNDSSGVALTPEHDERSEPSAPDPEAPASEAPPPSPILDAEGAIDQRVDRLFEAERQFRRGNRSLDRGRLVEALGAFTRAYELCPDQGEFLAYLGWSRHCLAPEDATSNDAALAELARARELAPDLHVTHLLHARVLASVGRAEEARGAYVCVIQLDPSSTEAQDALASIRS